MEKGLRWVQGTGAGERPYVPIQTPTDKRQPVSRLFDSAHAPYPRTQVTYVRAYSQEKKEESPER